MEYQLNITKRVPNPDYQEKRSPYDPESMRYLATTELLVTISEEQFEAIRKAVLEKF